MSIEFATGGNIQSTAEAKNARSLLEYILHPNWEALGVLGLTGVLLTAVLYAEVTIFGGFFHERVTATATTYSSVTTYAAPSGLLFLGLLIASIIVVPLLATAPYLFFSDRKKFTFFLMNVVGVALLMMVGMLGTLHDPRLGMPAWLKANYGISEAVIPSNTQPVAYINDKGETLNFNFIFSVTSDHHVGELVPLKTK